MYRHVSDTNSLSNSRRHCMLQTELAWCVNDMADSLTVKAL